MLPFSSYHVDWFGLVQPNSLSRRKSPGYITTILKQAGDAECLCYYMCYWEVNTT